MTTPKEALELAKPLIDIMASNSAAGSCEAKRAIDEALASLEGDAVDRVARIIDPMPFDPPKCFGFVASVINDRRERAITKARAILATGLVAGEAAIRAAEREKCAKVAEHFRPDVGIGLFCNVLARPSDIAAAIRSGA